MFQKHAPSTMKELVIFCILLFVYFRDELVTTKIGFEKLQKLNEEMVAMKEAGADTGHLER